MTVDSWPLLFVITFHALLFHAMPRFSRPGILFAVTVPEAFVSDGGRRLVSRYRAIVWSGAALALAVGLLFPVLASDAGSQGILSVAVVAANMMVSLCAWLWAHRSARAYAIPHSEIRVASLVPRDTSLPGGSLFASGPFGILLITAVLVATRWDQVAQGSHMAKTLGPLAVGAFYVVMMLTMAVSMARRTRQIGVEGMTAALEQRFRRLNVFVLVLAAYGAALMSSVVTLESIPAFGVALGERLGVLMLPFVLVNFGAAFWMFRVGQGGQRAVTATGQQDIGGDATPDDAWKIAGLFYYNPRDPAIWVEKRVGLGYTLNMGNSSAWLLIAMMLLPVIAAPLFFS